MKLSLIFLLGMVAFAAAANDDGIQNDLEEGVDCGTGTSNPCNCFTDLDRTRAPPVLINQNTDAGADDTAAQHETGIISSTLGAAADFRLAFTLDPAVFTTVDGPTVTSGHVAPNQAGFADATAYADPSVFFVDQTTDAAISACTYTRGGAGEQALNIIRTAPTATCGDAVNEVKLQATFDFKTALGQCGFTNTTVAANTIDGTDVTDTTPGQDGVEGNSYTRFLGKVKVRQYTQGGSLRAQEVIKVEDFPFQITILFPNRIQVTSDTISVIGQAEYGSAITHQIYDSTNNELDINVLFGTTYPYAITSKTLDGGIGENVDGDLITTLELDTVNRSLTPALAGFDLSEWTLVAASDADCSSAAAYDAKKICDYDGSTTVSLLDFVTIETVTDGEVVQTPYDATDDTDRFGTATPGGTALPGTRCVGDNLATADRDAQACLQNGHIRLVPRAGYCDFNLGLKLTTYTVCRDDRSGDGADAGTDATDSILSTYWDGSASTAESAPQSDATTHFLFNPSNGEQLPCDSANYRGAIDPKLEIYFQLASDNFCPRVIATGGTTEEMSLFEAQSEGATTGIATWGANCANPATCIDHNTYSAADCATIDAGEDLCRQSPRLTAESATPTGNERKTQDQFVFGTTVYVETRVSADAGVNIDTTSLTSLHIGESSRTSDVLPTTATDDVQATVQWIKRLIDGNAISNDVFHGADDATQITGINSGSTRVAFSDDITTNAFLNGNAEGTDASTGFFRTGGNTAAAAGSLAARLGESWQGVSRATVLMDEFTVQISDAIREAAEPVKFWATIAITYEPAAQQGALGARQVRTEQALPAGKLNRARALGSPVTTGGQASAQAGIRPAGQSGSAGSSSTIAGFSSTTVLAAAVVLGAVVVAAGASFFVVRKRRTAAARSAKRSSSSTELNDTAQVQV